MKSAILNVLFVAVFLLSAISDSAPHARADWLTLPGNYSHDAFSGQRVAQYAPVELPAVPQGLPLRTSGYTHYRSTLAYGQSADNYHRVEQWGDPVRPYGEWRFPFRPYSTPYPNWGAPFAGLNIGVGLNPGVGFNPGVGGGAGLGQPGGNAFGIQPPDRPAPGFQHQRFPNPAARTNGLAPYPAGRGTPYPVAPYYDGYYPNYRE